MEKLESEHQGSFKERERERIDALAEKAMRYEEVLLKLTRLT